MIHLTIILVIKLSFIRLQYVCLTIVCLPSASIQFSLLLIQKMATTQIGI